MDAYLRPILISAGIVVALNTFVVLPILSSPIINYFLGGAIAVYLFLGQFKKRENDQVAVTKELKTVDTLYLGLGTGLIAGSILALLFAFKMQDEEFKIQLINMINEASKLKSGGDLRTIEELTPAFVFVTSILTIIICASLSFLGSLATMPFFNRNKK